MKKLEANCNTLDGMQKYQLNWRHKEWIHKMITPRDRGLEID
jgi:hypothetical protein